MTHLEADDVRPARLLVPPHLVAGQVPASPVVALSRSLCTKRGADSSELVWCTETLVRVTILNVS